MEVRGDFQPSVRRALGEIDKNWETYPGLIVCGSHDPKDAESIIGEIRTNREKGLPFLGLCYGQQLAVVEWARNVLGIADATSEEWGTGTFVVKKREEPKIGLRECESWWSFYEAKTPENLPESYFVAPFHPEYQSWKSRPHPLLVNFLTYAQKHK